ncbi:MAG: c-di-GMP-binding flagellar brake protein YcgR [Flavobacteriales bacterium]|jgi:c-di-GMP-binding flagellar brake protein YcgR
MATETLNFDDLDLKIGQTIQIHPSLENQNERHDCTLIGCLPGQSIIVTASESGEFPSVEEGQRIVIRIMLPNGVALFPTTVLYVTDIPTLMVYLDIPKAVKFRLIRSASRIDVAMPVLASNLTNSAISHIAGKISDISTGGAGIEMYEALGEPGDSIILKGKFDIEGIQRRVSIRALIRSGKQLKSGQYSYGIQFNEEDEDQLLVLFGFIFNLMAFGNVQKIS